MNQALLTLVWERARHYCEYCCLPAMYSSIPFEVDHIIARKHGGRTTQDNLALACFFCNAAKGANIAGLDPVTGKLTALFHPRRQRWQRHFQWNGPVLVGRTRTGRTTIVVLAINDPWFVGLRAALMAQGVFPPPS